MALIEKLTNIADAVRGKTGKTEEMTLEQMATEISGIETGGSSNKEWLNDGDTHIWVTLPEGRTSPMLGVCPKGNVTVDWGDGTAPDTLTGTNEWEVVWTPPHNYAEPGDYVITLTVMGSAVFTGSGRTDEYAYILRHSAEADARNRSYTNFIVRFEFGNNISMVGNHALFQCQSITSVKVNDGATKIDTNGFKECVSLKSVNIPKNVTSLGTGAFESCHSLSTITIPGSVISIGSRAFAYCYGVRFYDFTRHTTVPTLVNADAFVGIAPDCEIRVPAALVDEWKAATNWASYANYIVEV